MQVESLEALEQDLQELLKEAKRLSDTIHPIPHESIHLPTHQMEVRSLYRPA